MFNSWSMHLFWHESLLGPGHDLTKAWLILPERYLAFPVCCGVCFYSMPSKNRLDLYLWPMSVCHHVPQQGHLSCWGWCNSGDCWELEAETVRYHALHQSIHVARHRRLTLTEWLRPYHWRQMCSGKLQCAFNPIFQWCYWSTETRGVLRPLPRHTGVGGGSALHFGMTERSPRVVTSQNITRQFVTTKFSEDVPWNKTGEMTEFPQHTMNWYYVCLINGLPSTWVKK